MTPHPGHEQNSLFWLSWCCYNKKYSALKEVNYLKTFLKSLVDKGFIIIYASRSYREDILELFNCLGIEVLGGVSRDDKLVSKEEFISKISSHPNNEYYYFEDDMNHLNKSNNTYNINCNNMWLGE